MNASFSDYSHWPQSLNGTYHASNKEYAGYYTSVIGNKSIEWVRQVAELDKPWMVTVASKAPHKPFTPAPWYAEGSGPASAWIDKLTAPRTPDYNASCPGFHWTVAHQPPLTDQEAAETDAVFRNRWRASMSVDDTIASMVAVVEELGLANKTYFFVT